MRETYDSRLLGQPMFYTVYTPPCYDESASPYPVIYLMHGSNEDDGHWLRLGIAAHLDSAIVSGELPPMIIVMPFGNVIANRNRFDDLSWANIFLQELVPHVESNYNIALEAAQRAIGGVSRGGFWAYQIALTHPDMFAAVGGHSAFFDLLHAPPEQNPLHLVTDTHKLGSMRLWLDRGVDDFAAPGLDIMADRLTERGLAHTYMIYPEGQHNNDYWRQHVAAYLAFYAADWILPAQSPNVEVTAAPANGFATNTPVVSRPVQSAAPATQASAAAASEALSVFFPVAAFPSLQTSLNSETLHMIRNGALDTQLVLDMSTAQSMRAAGMPLHQDTRIVDDKMLRNELWRNRNNLYSLLPMPSITLDYRLLWVDDVPVVDQLETYPLRFTANAANFDPALLTRMTLTGVTALARNTRLALDEHGVAWAAGGIQAYVMSSDFFHISNEVSIFGTCPQSSGVLLGGASSFCMKPDHLQLFSLLDVDIVELSGNHNNDFGYEAYRETLSFYQQQAIATIGGGDNLAAARTPLELAHHHNSIAMLACNDAGPYYALVNEDHTLLGGVRPGAAACDFDWLESLLPELAQRTDVLIVSVQHQEFEEYIPSDAQRNNFRRIAELGADVVIGTAAHKPQTYEFYPTQRGEIALIHYGLGNLFFDQPFWGNMRFFMDTLLIYDGQLQGLEVFPGIIDDAARPRLMTPTERENFLFFMFVEQNGF